MTELTSGIFEFLKKIIKGSSLTIAIVYTLGHILIAMCLIRIMTGATFWEAGSVALVEPLINGIWFYILHSIWKRF